MRTFIAFPVNETLRSYLQNLQDELNEKGVKGKWVPPTNQHLTILFLGDQPEEKVQALCADLPALTENVPPIEMTPADVNVFGRPPRVVYLGLKEQEPGRFEELAEELKESVQDHGLALDQKVLKRRAVPHLTLLRLRHRKESKCLRSLGELTDDGFQWNEEVASTPVSPVTFRTLTVYTSELYPQGPVYHVYHESLLTG